MATLEEKLSLLSEMISFSVVDGKIHEKEYAFITLIANELGIEKSKVNKLFQDEIKPVKIVSETDRIKQFYRLALLMHSDSVLHQKEDHALHEIGIKMGLNPKAMDRILALIKNSKDGIVDPKMLFKIFEVQHN